MRYFFAMSAIVEGKCGQSWGAMRGGFLMPVNSARPVVRLPGCNHAFHAACVQGLADKEGNQIQLSCGNKVTQGSEGYPSDLRFCHPLVANLFVEIPETMIFSGKKGLPTLFARPYIKS